MNLIANWRDVILRAWSVKLMGFAVFIEVAEQVVPLLADYVPWWVSVGILLVGVVARVMPQADLPENS